MGQFSKDGEGLLSLTAHKYLEKLLLGEETFGSIFLWSISLLLLIFASESVLSAVSLALDDSTEPTFLHLFGILVIICAFLSVLFCGGVFLGYIKKRWLSNSAIILSILLPILIASQYLLDAQRLTGSLGEISKIIAFYYFICAFLGGWIAIYEPQRVKKHIISGSNGGKYEFQAAAIIAISTGGFFFVYLEPMGYSWANIMTLNAIIFIAYIKTVLNKAYLSPDSSE